MNNGLRYVFHCKFEIVIEPWSHCHEIERNRKIGDADNPCSEEFIEPIPVKQCYASSAEYAMDVWVAEAGPYMPGYIHGFWMQRQMLHISEDDGRWSISDAFALSSDRTHTKQAPSSEQSEVLIGTTWGQHIIQASQDHLQTHGFEAFQVTLEREREQGIARELNFFKYRKQHIIRKALKPQLLWSVLWRVGLIGKAGVVSHAIDAFAILNLLSYTH
jgi:hypothetical protein